MPGKRKRKQVVAKPKFDNSESSPCTSASSDSSHLSVHDTPKRNRTGSQLTTETPFLIRDSLKKFTFVERSSMDTSDKGDHPMKDNEVNSPVASSVTNEQLMLKLEVVLGGVHANGGKIERLTDTVDELRY